MTERKEIVFKVKLSKYTDQGCTSTIGVRKIGGLNNLVWSSQYTIHNLYDYYTINTQIITTSTMTKYILVSAYCTMVYFLFVVSIDKDVTGV